MILPGLHISENEIRGKQVVSVKLDTSRLTSNKTYTTVLVLNTNGDMVRLPVSCVVSPVTTEILPDVNKRDKDGYTPLNVTRKVGQNIGRGLLGVLVGGLFAFIGLLVGGIVSLPLVLLFGNENMTAYTGVLGFIIGAIYGFTSVWFK